MDKFKDKYRIPSTRRIGWDYGSPGLYFITICTKNHECYFGIIPVNDAADHNMNIHNNPAAPNPATLQPTKMGIIAYDYWKAIPDHFSFIELDEFVIMPNHVHGILFINKLEYTSWQTNQFGPQAKNLASVIRGYEAVVKAFATKNKIEFNWQERYHDHIIRNHGEFARIAEYIRNNPANWQKDKFYK